MQPRRTKMVRSRTAKTPRPNREPVILPRTHCLRDRMRNRAFSLKALVRTSRRLGLHPPNWPDNRQLPRPMPVRRVGEMTNPQPCRSVPHTGSLFDQMFVYQDTSLPIVLGKYEVSIGRLGRHGRHPRGRREMLGLLGIHVNLESRAMLETRIRGKLVTLLGPPIRLGWSGPGIYQTPTGGPRTTLPLETTGTLGIAGIIGKPAKPRRRERRLVIPMQSGLAETILPEGQSRMIGNLANNNNNNPEIDHLLRSMAAVTTARGQGIRHLLPPHPHPLTGPTPQAWA